jgi:hypothetical protein
LKKLKPLDRENFLADIARGMRVHDASDKSPWSHAWWYQLKDQDESFAEAWEEAARMGAVARLTKLENAGHERAVEGVSEPVGFYQGVPGAHVQRYSDGLLKFFATVEGRRAGESAYEDKSSEAPLTINIHLDSGFQGFRDCILGALQPYPEAWEAVLAAMGDYVGKSEASAQEAPQGRREPKTIKGDD